MGENCNCVIELLSELTDARLCLSNNIPGTRHDCTHTSSEKCGSH